MFLLFSFLPGSSDYKNSSAWKKLVLLLFWKKLVIEILYKKFYVAKFHPLYIAFHILFSNVAYMERH